MLGMTDEAGADTKIVAAPIEKVFAGYAHIKDIHDVAQHWRDRIAHFFEHYKDLEKGKWVKIDGWFDAAGRENADKCLLSADPFGPSYVTSDGARANLRLGSRNFLVPQNWVNAE